LKLDLSNCKKAAGSLKEALKVSKNLKTGHISSPEEKLLKALEKLN
jgi:hypothetical protein